MVTMGGCIYMIINGLCVDCSFLKASLLGVGVRRLEKSFLSI